MCRGRSKSPARTIKSEGLTASRRLAVPFPTRVAPSSSKWPLRVQSEERSLVSISKTSRLSTAKESIPLTIFIKKTAAGRGPMRQIPFPFHPDGKTDRQCRKWQANQAPDELHADGAYQFHDQAAGTKGQTLSTGRPVPERWPGSETRTRVRKRPFAALCMPRASAIAILPWADETRGSV